MNLNEKQKNQLKFNVKKTNDPLKISPTKFNFVAFAPRGLLCSRQAAWVSVWGFCCFLIELMGVAFCWLGVGAASVVRKYVARVWLCGIRDWLGRVGVVPCRACRVAWCWPRVDCWIYWICIVFVTLALGFVAFVGLIGVEFWSAMSDLLGWNFFNFCCYDCVLKTLR